MPRFSNGIVDAMKLKKLILEYGLYAVWLQALVATLGSLYFSEVAKFTPCVLCWYQRICMYPLLVLMTVGIIKKDNNVVQYALPLSLIGTVISIYHNLLYYKVLPEAVAPCEIGASCLTRFISWFGFVTIPLLALVAFLVIDVLLILHRKYNSNE